MSFATDGFPVGCDVKKGRIRAFAALTPYQRLYDAYMTPTPKVVWREKIISKSIYFFFTVFMTPQLAFTTAATATPTSSSAATAIQRRGRSFTCCLP